MYYKYIYIYIPLKLQCYSIFFGFYAKVSPGGLGKHPTQKPLKTELQFVGGSSLFVCSVFGVICSIFDVYSCFHLMELLSLKYNCRCKASHSTTTQTRTNRQS